MLALVIAAVVLATLTAIIVLVPLLGVTRAIFATPFLASAIVVVLALITRR
jgi:hypothetical protein